MSDLGFATQLRPAVDLAVAVLAAMAAIAVELLRAAGAFLVLAAAFLAATFLAATLRFVLAVLVAVVGLALAATLAVLAALVAKRRRRPWVRRLPTTSEPTRIAEGIRECRRSP